VLWSLRVDALLPKASESLWVQTVTIQNKTR
jgi:hypothetical protein